MDDTGIIDLYWRRAQKAIKETAYKYGKYCHAIAFAILRDEGDSEECVNDTYLHAWDAMPPEHPRSLKAFLGRITRNLAIDRLRYRSADKRGGEYMAAVEELDACTSAEDLEKTIEAAELTAALERFLSELPMRTRKLFMCRYWYLNSIREISDAFSMSESAVKMTLLRTREQLREFLKKEGFDL